MCLIKRLNKSYKIYHSQVQTMSKIMCMYNKMLTRVLRGWCPHSSFSLFQTFYFILKMHICRERKGRRVRWQPRTSRAHLSLQSPDRLLRKPVKPRVAEPLCSNRSVSGAYFSLLRKLLSIKPALWHLWVPGNHASPLSWGHSLMGNSITFQLGASNKSQPAIKIVSTLYARLIVSAS